MNGFTGFQIIVGLSDATAAPSYAEPARLQERYRRLANSATYTERYLGYAVSAGKINSDALADIVISDPWLESRGKIIGMYGRTSFASVYNADSIFPPLGFSMQGASQGDRVGMALSSSDINGDGLADVVSSNANSLLEIAWGQPSSSAVYSLSSGNSSIKVMGMQSANMAVVTGDMNGDEYAETIIGLPDHNLIKIIPGSNALPSILNITSADASTVLTIYGSGLVSTIGRVIALANLNGDAFMYLIVLEIDSSCISSTIRTFLGRADLSIYRSLDSSSMYAVAFYKIINIPGCPSLRLSVSASDMDGNGLDDVLIGSGASSDDACAWIVFS